LSFKTNRQQEEIMTMFRSPAMRLRLVLAGLALPTLLAACTAGEPVSADDGPELEVEVTAGRDEPTRRAPLGYTGFPVEGSSPYSPGVEGVGDTGLDGL
jgi:hypothetical protein